MKQSASHIRQSRFIVVQGRYAGRNDGNSRVAEYESLLDLFTLISFILIFAAFLYIGRYQEASAAASELLPQITQHASGPAKSIPEDVLLLSLYREDKNTVKLAVFDGQTGNIDTEPVTKENIANKLNVVVKSLVRPGVKIELCIHDVDDGDQTSISVKAAMWFRGIGYTKPIYAYSSE